MSLILSSDLSSVIDEMSAIELANDIFFAIEEIPTIAVIRDGKAALVEILDELEKLSSWSI